MLKLLLLVCAISLAAAATPKCGVPAIDPDLTPASYEPAIEIVGGKAAVPGSWPWMVEVIRADYGMHWCGGTLLNEEWVISAAHCFENNPKLSRYLFSVGGHVEYDLNEGTRQTSEAEAIFPHPKYKSRTDEYDVALIKLKTTVTMNNRVSPACLATERPDDGVNAFITGWGDQEADKHDTNLQQAMVPIVSQATCKRAYPTWIYDSMICAGYPKGGTDSCQGDSGGPMVVQDKDTGVWSLVGVTSWGIGCADAGYYGVYADVSYIVNEWISETMAKN